MGISEALGRVDADLERGHTYLAQQRLAGLIAAHPSDLTLRARRAAVHRRVGDRVQAGRWGFLTEDVTAAELAAFERAYRSPAVRLRALRLAGDPWRELSPEARDRYLTLTAAAKAETPAGEGEMSTLGCLGVFLGLLAVTTVVAVGLWTSIAYLIGLVL
ncbi:DUF6584 family protein [Actinoplanes sp. M2I2]|uniref:DUF6584 family protein n=1 Tax=Actinoplanes sp. M2I2 TaxID=1734444 RepID=UPI0020205C4C|nr:DUF6584 family protein [Actinoplanes sp. M2I2]